MNENTNINPNSRTNTPTNREHPKNNVEPQPKLPTINTSYTSEKTGISILGKEVDLDDLYFKNYYTDEQITERLFKTLLICLVALGFALLI